MPNCFLALWVLIIPVAANPAGAETMPAQGAQSAGTAAASPAAARTPDAGNRLKPEDRPAKAREALDPATGARARFDAVYALAFAGYSLESAEALGVIASETRYEPGTRSYAATGLEHFASAMPEEVRKAIGEKLLHALEAEKEKLPDQIMRTLVRWDYADRVRTVMGGQLRGHPMEVEVLRGISSRDEALDRLWELYQAAPAVNTSASACWHVVHLGEALIHWKDERGIDLLLECLAVREPWPIDNPSPQAQATNTALFHQSRLNVFERIARALDDDFGLSQAGGAIDERLAGPIQKMTDWWKANRETWSLEEATSTAVPIIESGRPLTKRQARVLAAKLATDAFAEKDFRRPDGRPVGKIVITPDRFNEVRQEDGRWVLKMIVSSGPEASVGFALDGTDAKVRVIYGLR